MLFLVVSFSAKVKFFRFWPKTVDYRQAFWPKSRLFFVVLLLLIGRCYEAKLCAILLLLDAWFSFSAKVKFPFCCRNRCHSLWCSYSSLEGAMKLTFVPFCSFFVLQAMSCRFMCCLCLCKQSAGKGRTCSRLTLEMQSYTAIHVIIVQIKV